MGMFFHAKKWVLKSLKYRFYTDTLFIYFSLKLLSDKVKVPKRNTPLDTTVAYLAEHLAYEKRERDLVILRHDVSCILPSGVEVMFHLFI